MAAYALAAVGTPAVPALKEAINHENEGVRVEASYALAQIGSGAESAVDVMIEKAKDSNAEVRRYIPEAFGAIGPAAAPAVPSINR